MIIQQRAFITGTYIIRTKIIRLCLTNINLVNNNHNYEYNGYILGRYPMNYMELSRLKDLLLFSKSS